MGLSNYALDKFVAPHLSELTECEVPDMSDHDGQCDQWVLNFVLNSMLRVEISQPTRPFCFTFLRRAEAAFYEYDNARKSLLGYLSGERHAVSRYLRAVLHFESFLSQAYQACLILGRIIGKKKLFDKDDGSVTQRLNTVYNKSKHADSAIANGDVPGDTTMQVWLRNTGIECADAALTYKEMVEILADLASWAGRLSNPAVSTAEQTGSA